jgi:hypothetical protein
VSSPLFDHERSEPKKLVKIGTFPRFLEFFVVFPHAVLIFVIAGLLYLLRFERVDNLGAYSIPSESGLLIPSGYIN